jgi:hypothetical protein
VLRCGDDSVAGPRASAALHRLEGFATKDRPDVAVPTVRELSNLDFPIVSLDVGSQDRCLVEEIPAMTPAASLVGLAPLIGEKAWRVAFDSARRQGLTLARFERVADRLEQEPGGAVVLGYLATGVLSPDGEGERHLQQVLHGFTPQPEWGVVDVVPGRRLDCLWRHVGLALEYDGRDHHVLPTDRDNDGLRDLECESHGVKVLRITKGMLDADATGVRELIERIYHRRLLELVPSES